MKMQYFFDRFIKMFGLFSLLGLLALAGYAVYGVGNFIVTDFLINGNPFEQDGITDTKRVTFKLGGNYQADIPTNYIRMPRQMRKAQQQEQWALFLWTLFPTFEGYSQANEAKFHTGYKEDSALVRINIGYAANLSEDEFVARLGQKGVRELLKMHPKFRLSEKQPYRNLTEYVYLFKSRNPKNEDYFEHYYIYDAGDHATLIDCGSDFNTMCSAEKFWGNTRIHFRYTFREHLLRDFGRIETGIDNLFNSFNIKEISQIDFIK